MPKAAIDSVDVTKIHAIAELERMGYEFKENPGTPNQIKLRCPVKTHLDKKPSAILDISTNQWHCFGCHNKGDFVTFVCHIAQAERHTVIADLSTRYDLNIKRIISSAKIEEYHQQIWTCPLYKALADRGVTQELMRTARLGYDKGRITIPIFDKNDDCINIRRYLPGAPNADKMKNTTGMGSIALYQPRQVGYNKVWICGGEMKALVAGSYLNKIDIGAVSTTAGEGSWSETFTPLFENKIVYICFDVDEVGKLSAIKLARLLSFAATKVFIIRLPLDTNQFPHGDINDWVSATTQPQDFVDLMDRHSVEFTYEVDLQEDTLPLKEVELNNITNSDNVGYKLVFDGIVSAIDTVPYLIPYKVGVSCTKDQPAICLQCPVKPLPFDEKSRKAELCVSPTTSGVLDLIGSLKRELDKNIKTALKMPNCPVAEFTIRKHYRYFECRLTTKIRMTAHSESSHVQQAAYVLADLVDVELNVPYSFTGKVLPQPRTQQAVLLIEKAEKVEDTLGTFNISSDELESLKIFQPVIWSLDALDKQLVDYYSDIEINVTRIYQRRNLHMVFDLTWFSPLLFNFDGRQEHGWLNSIIVGDSSQGKSETAIRLMEHYGLGIRHDCKNATMAGLLGGLQQVGTRWFVTWGVIPINDRQLVILEEIKGLAPEIFARLTDMRSSGIAELSMIEKRRAFARTRLVMISNPRSCRPISTYSFGVECLKELVPTLEDIRRFDIAIVVSKEQVDLEEINKLNISRPSIQHKYTNVLCRKLLLWAWTRTEHQIKFEDGAETLCISGAIELCKKYTEALPLVDSGTMRFKIARMAIALAMKTFSIDASDTSTVIVRKCHVEYILKFIDSLYEDPIFGYSDFSEGERNLHQLLNTDNVQKHIRTTKFPKTLIDNLLAADEITLTDFQDWMEVDRDTAQRTLSFFIRQRALFRVYKSYYKTSGFISLLKEMKRQTFKLDTEEFQPEPKEEF